MTTANKRVGRAAVVDFTVGANPSNTAKIQEAFIKEIQRRLRNVRGVLRRSVGYENDALKLSANLDDRDVFTFPREVSFTEQFKEWLREALKTDLSLEQVREGEHWTAEFLENAYVRGTQTAQGRLMQAGLSVTADAPADILERPIAVSQLRDIYTRAFENLQGISKTMAQQVRETLTTGIAQGWNPRKMARNMNEEITELTRTRAVTLARTETIESHATATLDEYERTDPDLAVSHGAFQTAADEDVCPFCRKIDDVPLTIDEMRSTATRFRGQIYRAKPAAHPNCRCSVIPKIGVDNATLAPLRERVPGSLINQ